MLIPLVVGLFTFCLLATVCNLVPASGARIAFAIVTSVLAGWLYVLMH